MEFEFYKEIQKLCKDVENDFFESDEDSKNYKADDSYFLDVVLNSEENDLETVEELKQAIRNMVNQRKDALFHAKMHLDCEDKLVNTQVVFKELVDEFASEVDAKFNRR